MYIYIVIDMNLYVRLHRLGTPIDFSSLSTCYDIYSLRLALTVYRHTLKLNVVLKYRAPEKAIFGLMAARENACLAPVW